MRAATLARRGVATVVAVLSMLAWATALGVPASAGAVTFGADLSRAPNAPLITCGAGVLNQTLGVFWQGTQAQTCLWSSVTLGSSQALTAPADGTITTVRVRAGATTGPMQIDVVRFLTQNTFTPGHPNLACCFLQKYGPVFTPAPNAVTTVAVNLPVQEDPFPPPGDTTTIAANDQLALAVLAPNVPVPLFATNGYSADLNTLSYAWYPAPTAPGVPEPGPNPLGGFADLSGFQVLMNADLDTGGGAAGGGAGGGGAPAGAGGPAGGQPARMPVLNLPGQTIPVRGGTASVPIQCLVVDCRGTLALQNGQAALRVGAARASASAVRASAAKRQTKARKLVSYGSAHFALKAGKQAKIKVKLNAAGRKLLKHGGSAKVWANVRFSAGGGAPKSVRIKLKR
ncbi:MAG TPA: hypothetical protein VLJ42_12115 [Solirubrobacteraceae bacterium]|nr:hypothetical protein [Solirubrobacteraceae bacterium]